MKKLILVLVLGLPFLYASIANAASVVSFTASSPNSTNQAVTLTWQASAPTDAQIDVICPSDTGGLGFYIKENGSYPNCAKGGIASFTSQSHNTLTIQPQGNTKTVSVDFVLTLLNNGISGETKKVTVTFAPAVTLNPTITSFVADFSTSSKQAISISWQTSTVAPEVILEVICVPGTITFLNKEGNSYPNCEKGGVAYFQNQSSNSLTLLPSNNTERVSVDFILTLRKDGVTIERRKATVTIEPTVAIDPSIIHFAASDPNQANPSVNISWKASTFADASLDVVCTPGTIKFKTSKGNFPTCEKGGVWTWDSTASDSLTVYPIGNTQTVSAKFTLTLRKNGLTIDSRSVVVNFPPTVAPASIIASLSATAPTALSQFTTIFWQSTGVSDYAVLDVICPSNSGIKFYVPDTGGYPICEKGGITFYSNRTSAKTVVWILNNTRSLSVEFMLTLFKDSIAVDSKKIKVTFPPAAEVSKPVTPQAPMPPKDQIFENRIRQAEERAEEAFRSLDDAHRKLTEEQKARIKKLADTMLLRLSAAFGRLDKFTARIDSRLDKFDEQNISSKEAEAKLEETRAIIREGKGAMQSIPAEVNRMLESDNLEAAYNRFQGLVEQIINDYIIRSYTNIVEIIEITKKGLKTN